MLPFCVGRFPEEQNAVAAFPTCWLTDETKQSCHWPTENVKRAVKKQTTPDPGVWSVCPVVVMAEFGQSLTISSKNILQKLISFMR